MKPKVVIFSGGMGTRLKEETDYRPKPMVNIGDKPILWHIMKIYSHYGYNEFVLCLGYKGEMIKKYFYDYEVLNNDFTIDLSRNKSIHIHDSGIEHDWKVTLADTGLNTLKGGRLKRAAKYIDSDVFMLTYGDGVCDVNIDELMKFHLSHGKIGTVTGVRPPSLFGELVVENGQAVLFAEKPQTSTGLINGGFFIFNRKILDYVTEAEDCDFEFGPLEKLASEGELMVFEHSGQWQCMDTYRDMEYLNKLWNSNNAFWKVWDKN
ncbi:MAG: glucose-1-phosphate cytidylyltransferase [Syntrophomonadaceae bacterium]|nr:glucose-1-phosphate cytidylyltransferase [Syntrophomonadaceae bacterium]